MNQGKTRVWNRCGDRPPNCEHLFNTDGEPNDASRGDHDLPTDRQGVRILGTPLGHAHFVQAELAKKIGEHGTLLERIRNYLLRVVHPALSLNFAVQHDAGIRQCLEDLLHTPVTSEMWEMASLPFSTGGLGLRNAQRTRSTAYWASWADVVPMIRLRHEEVADHIVLSLSRGLGGFHLEGAFESRAILLRAGIDAPEWGDVDHGQVPGTTPTTSSPVSHVKGGKILQVHRWRRLSSNTTPGWSLHNKF